MVCSKPGVTVSPGSCAAAGIAVAMAMAANARANEGSYVHDGILLCMFLRYKYPSTGPIKSTKNATKIMYHGGMTKPLELQLDRTTKTPLADQICMGITAAIESGVLAAGARLPSWMDLAAQLGVARGTVRSAYDKLAAAQLIVASRATGTRVTERRHFIRSPRDPAPEPGSFMEMYQELTSGPAIFQMGVPAKETFPAKLFARIRSCRARRSKCGATLSGPTWRTRVAARDRCLSRHRSGNRVLALSDPCHRRLWKRPRIDASRARP